MSKLEESEPDFQLWADSFHEGEWACRQVAQQFENLGGRYEVEYRNGFIPFFVFFLNGKSISVEVYGNYKSWSPIPKNLEKLLEWGKPDFVLVQSSSEKILIAVEETAATPTGNQALQRCERQFGSAIEGFPFWYLIAEFGTHSDGGTRRNSIWPALMGLEIMTSLEIPSIVLHYSDSENPEDYTKGRGVSSLFTVLTTLLINCSDDLPPLQGLESEIEDQVSEMINFVEKTAKNSLYFLPPIDKSKIKKLTSNLTLVGDKRNLPKEKRDQLLSWPLVSNLSNSQKEEQETRAVKKKDKLALRLEAAIAKGEAYGIIKGSGSKPQKRDELKSWIDSQNSRQIDWESKQIDSKYENAFRLKLEDFPPAPTGFHVITAPRILYLFDEFQSVRRLLQEAFPERSYEQFYFENKPTMVYVSNSVKPGRIFGDPYTGQISAYATTFGALSLGRKVVVYFPHQSIALAAENMSTPNNKGLRIMSELTDLMIFGGGIALDPKTGLVA